MVYRNVVNLEIRDAIESKLAECIPTSRSCYRRSMSSDHATVVKCWSEWPAYIPSGENASMTLVREPCTLAGLAGIISGLYCTQACRKRTMALGSWPIASRPSTSPYAKPNNLDTTNWGLSSHPGLHGRLYMQAETVEEIVERVCSFPSFPMGMSIADRTRHKPLRIEKASQGRGDDPLSFYPFQVNI